MSAPDDASLGVGHVWTNVKCPAYRTLEGADCTCNVQEETTCGDRSAWGDVCTLPPLHGPKHYDSASGVSWMRFR